jgi:hypothetical protein
MSNPTLNDLTCALTAGAVRNVQRDLSGVHDSDKCDCEICRAADEYEAREAREDKFPVSEAENVSTASRIAGIDALADRKGALWADVATIRAALMDVIDEGCYHDDDLSHEWQLDSGLEEFANEQRVEFADAVLRRLHELQSPPHNAPRLDTGAGRRHFQPHREKQRRY